MDHNASAMLQTLIHVSILDGMSNNNPKFDVFKIKTVDFPLQTFFLLKKMFNLSKLHH